MIRQTYGHAGDYKVKIHRLSMEIQRVQLEVG